LFVIAGPTAAGKSARALGLAPRIDGEIISADSRHVYRRMDIGTNKPDAGERQAVRHHGLDLREPDEPFSLADYLRVTRAAIDDVIARGRTPMLVGGTGQYIRAVLEGWQAPEVPPNDAIRARWAAYEREHGNAALFAALLERDPDAAQTIDGRNSRRVIRALEVIEVSGQLWSAVQRRSPLPLPVEWIYVNLPREQLYATVDARLERMLAHGWLDETRALLEFLNARGHEPDAALRLPAMSALGYRELALVSLGRLTLDGAIEAIKRETRRFIRMQDTWFRKIGQNLGQD
jgi:tRNA dimethylallyltransferase